MTTLGLLNNAGNWSPSETDVYQDLVDENFQATGVDIRYLPKNQINLDKIFGESTISEFKEGFVIEVYIQRISKFNGDDDIYSKFGMFHTDEATLNVSVRRFKVEGAPHGLQQPQEEDLIYMPHSKTMWKIRKCKPDEEYYQFGSNHVWRLEVGLYDPSHETFENQIVQPSEVKSSADPVDGEGLSYVFGIDMTNRQGEGDVFERQSESLSPTTPETFNSDDPFGGA